MPSVLFLPEEVDALRVRCASEDAACAQVAVVTSVDPIKLLRAAAPLFGRAQLVCQPDGTVVAGLGAAWRA